MSHQSALLIKPGSRLKCTVSTGTPTSVYCSHWDTTRVLAFVQTVYLMTEMVTDTNQSISCKLLKAHRVATGEMVTQIMYVYLHLYSRFVKFWDLGFVSFEIKGYSRASKHSNRLDTPINSAQKPNHTALIILNASNIDLYNYVTVELTSSAHESVAGQYKGVDGVDVGFQTL